MRGAAWREGDFAFAFDADAADGVVWGRAEKFTFFGDLLNSERLAETANITGKKARLCSFWRAKIFYAAGRFQQALNCYGFVHYYLVINPWSLQFLRGPWLR